MLCLQQERMAERHRRTGSVASLQGPAASAGQQQLGSPLQPGPAWQQQQQPELEDVRTEEVHQGVFLTLGRRPDGQAMLKRIRFSRQFFNKDAADAWWLEHKQEMALRWAGVGGAFWLLACEEPAGEDCTVAAAGSDMTGCSPKA